jgi:hypothetical protein
VEDALEERIARNEVIFRDVNEALRRGRWPGDQTTIAFRCECARLGCSRLIELTPADYERVRENPKWFVVAADHELSDGETVIEAHGEYLVVEKQGKGGLIAEATDPRS